MTPIAEREPVGDVKPKAWVVAPRFDVVRVQAALGVVAAVLAGIAVSLFDGASPGHVLPVTGLQLIGAAAFPVLAALAYVLASQGCADSLSALRRVTLAESLGVALEDGSAEVGESGNRRLLRGELGRSVVALDEPLRSPLSQAGELTAAALARQPGRLWALALANAHAMAAYVSGGLSLKVAEPAVGYLGDRGRTTAATLAKHSPFYHARAASE